MPKTTSYTSILDYTYDSSDRLYYYLRNLYTDYSSY